MRVLGWAIVVSSVLAGAVFAQESAQGTLQRTLTRTGTNAEPVLESVSKPDSGEPRPEGTPAPAISTPAAPVVAAPLVPAPIPAPAARTSKVAPAAPAAVRVQVNSTAPSIVLVMESSGGLHAATELRTALTQVGYRVLSAAEAQRKSRQPDVLLTVAFTPPTATGGSRAVHVAYWGRDGQTDSLTAASLATLDQLNAVALALSSALIDRHRNDDVSSAADNARPRFIADPRAPSVLYAMISATPRTNVRLRVEDF